MPGALNVLLTFCLLQGAPCQRFEILVPESITVLTGSCVTIPCSFDISVDQNENLDDSCKAIWKHQKKIIFDSASPKQNGKLLGELRKKNCTTTFNDFAGSTTFFFRLECNNKLKYDFDNNFTEILIKDDPPSPTLTPSTLNVKEGSSVSLLCSATAPCLSHPPNLTWTPKLGESQEILQENRYKTKLLTSALTFNASHLHHGQNISCTAVYQKLDGSTKSASSEKTLTLNISFAPQILSFGCIKTTVQFNCSCETVGNPPPDLQWILEEIPLNPSDTLSIKHESLNNTVVRSFITVSLQGRKVSKLLCHSSNSLGSAAQKMNMFEGSCQVTVPTFIITIVLMALFVLLAIIFRNRRTVCNYTTKSQSLDDTCAAAMSQSLTREMKFEVSITAENVIYGNTSMTQKSDHSTSHQRGQQGVSKSSTQKENDDVVYTSVIWKGKKTGAGSQSSGSSHMEEKRCMMTDTSTDFLSKMEDTKTLYSNIKTG